MRVRIDARVKGYAPGDVADLSDELAAQLEAAGKATVLGETPAKPKRRKRSKADDTTTEGDPPDAPDTEPGAPVLDADGDEGEQDQE